LKGKFAVDFFPFAFQNFGWGKLEQFQLFFQNKFGGMHGGTLVKMFLI
jgi:hypothetical protein